MTPNGRFAPSPTGPLHVGNLRTAVVAWLLARTAGARFAVRSEDLDVGRVRPHWAAEQEADLAAIGVTSDGPVLRQSTRLAAYAAALAELESLDRVYPCFCTRAEIRAAVSAPHGPEARDAYPGTCRHLSQAERAARMASGRPPALRLRADAAAVEFEDRIAGPCSGQVDDFVLRRNDGAYAYNLAVVVDDGFQQIGEVVRGSDLLASTPRQLLLMRYLELPRPAYTHVPLVTGPDGQRLGKRHGSAGVRELGPTRILDFIADSLELPRGASAADLLPSFDPDALPRTEPVLDLAAHD